MKEFNHYKLRQDTEFFKLKQQKNEQPIYLLKHPESGDIFEFRETEYWLCKILENHWQISEIISQFNQKFAQSIEPKVINKFYQTILELDLLEHDSEIGDNTSSDSLSTQTALQQDDEKFSNFDNFDSLSSPTAISYDAKITKRKISSSSRKIILFNPYLLLKTLVFLTPHPKIILFFFILVFLVSWGIILNHQFLLWQDFNRLVAPIPLLIRLLFAWAFIHLLSQLIKGVVYTYFGGKVQEFGCQFIFGLIPRFYISQAQNKSFKRQEKLWIFSIPLLFKIFLLNLGIIIWFIFRSTQFNISIAGLMFARISLLSFVLTAHPFWHNLGYLWLTTYLNDSKLQQRSLLILKGKFTPDYLPSNLSRFAQLKLKLYAIIHLMFVLVIPGCLLLLIALFLGEKLRITGLVIFSILVLPIWQWYQQNQTPSQKTPKISSKGLKMNEQIITSSSQPVPNKIALWLKQNSLKLGLLLGLIIILPLPYQYKPSGAIKLLPPQQKEIQADISGKITRVMITGGDGSWLTSKAILAEIKPSRQLNLSTPIENDLLVKLEEINYQRHLQQKAQAKLEELLSTPRPETVIVAKRQLEIAQQELEKAKSEVNSATNVVAVAQSQLQEGIVRLDFRQREASRLDQLYQEGAIPLQDLEDAQRLTEIAKVEVETLKKNIETNIRELEEQKQNVNIKMKEIDKEKANLSLVMSGPHPREIEAARQEINAIASQIKRLEQQLNNTQEELQGRQLLMPFDGYIITPYLDQKQGTYIEQGETFAIAEDPRKITAEIQIPESDAGEFSLGAETEIKLTAYPDRKIIGEVVNIEPVTQEENNGNFVQVMVEIPNDDQLLKSGMTGYAKIEGEIKPLGVVIFRPIIRFIQIELWSWIP